MAAPRRPEPGAIAAPYGGPLEHLGEELARLDVLVRGQAARAQRAAGDEVYRGLAISDGEIAALLARPPGVPSWAAEADGTSLEEARSLVAYLATGIAARERASAAAGRAPSRLTRLSQRLG